MSHFTVLVHLTEEEVNNNVKECLAIKLQPYHEFECTGTHDQYVIKVDETEEKMYDYNTGTVDVVYDEDGAMVGSIYSDQCKKYWNRAGYGYSSDDKLELPEGYVVRETKLNEIYTFEGFLRDWCGYRLDGDYSSLEDGRFYRFTNPNAKWDWWTVGGRWSDFFLDTNGEKQNIIQKKVWDIPGVTANVISEFTPFFDRFEEHADKFEGLVFVSWDECRNKFTNEEGYTNYSMAREFYHNQEYRNVLKTVFDDCDDEYEWLLYPENFYNVSREGFIKARIYERIGTFAVLDAAGWHAKGSMGWFASVSDEKADWSQIYLDKVASIPDNDYLVVVDCHI